MIFSENESKGSGGLWDKINKVKDLNFNNSELFTVIWEAIYILGCKCQELENQLKEKDKKVMEILKTELKDNI